MVPALVLSGAKNRSGCYLKGSVNERCPMCLSIAQFTRYDEKVANAVWMKWCVWSVWRRWREYDDGYEFNQPSEFLGF